MSRNMIIFKDFYKYYPMIKYEYEYGLYYNKELAKMLFQSELQNRRFNSVIGNYMEEDIDQIDYSNLFGSNQPGVKTKQKLINKNGYNFLSDKWFYKVYKLYGSFLAPTVNVQSIINKSIKKIIIEMSKNESTNDLNKIDSLTNILLYDLDKIKSTAVHQKTPSKTQNKLDKTSNNMTKEELKRIHKNVQVFLCYFQKIIYGERYNTLHDLKEINNLNYPLKVFKGEELYRNCWKDLPAPTKESLIDLIDFFSQFTFLGELGYELKQKISFEMQDRPKIFVRGVASFYGLAQESIYRCLFAIYKHRGITLQKMENRTKAKLPDTSQSDGFKITGFPIKVFYKGHTLYEENAFPYVLVFDIEAKKFKSIPLNQGFSIKVEKKYNFEIIKKPEIIKQIDTAVYHISVNFYYNDIQQNGENTEYILERIKSRWQYEQTNQQNDQFVLFDSIYYPKNKKWKVKSCMYEIKNEDDQVFCEWINSFGEFAQILSKKPRIKKIELKLDELYENFYSLPEDYYEAFEELVCLKKEPKNNAEEKIEDYQYSLCNPYNSEMIMQMLDYYNSQQSETQKIYLPPTAQEIFWFQYIMDNFPNIFRMFFYKLNPNDEIDVDEKAIKMVKMLTQTEIERCSNTFQPFEVAKKFATHKCCDIAEGVVKKYATILYAIKYNKLMEYNLIHDETEENKLIIPYAFEYHVSTANTRDSRTPFLIMAYDMNQKRIISLNYKTIVVKTSDQKSTILKDYKFHEFHKLYHLLGTYIRYEEFLNNESISSIFDLVKIIKRFPKNSWKNKLSDTYKKLKVKTTQNKTAMQCLQEPLTNAYQYLYEYIDGTRDTSNHFEEEKKSHGVCSYGEEEIQYRAKILCYFEKICQLSDNNFKKLQEILANIPETHIYNLIAGNPPLVLNLLSDEKKQSKINEISYSNEQMKSTVFSFSYNIDTNIKNKDKINIDKIYEVFREFICSGKYINSKLKFSILYERFNYRKIQMGILALKDIINEIEPNEMEELIETRKKTMKRGICNNEKNNILSTIEPR